MNDNYSAESKIVEIPVDQIGQNTKKQFFQYKICHKTSQSTLMKRDEDKTVGGIFINYGDLHYNYQHS